MDFAARLEMLIKAKNTSQRAIAEYLGIRRPSISDWKNQGTIPGADTAAKLAAYLGTTVEYLVTGNPPEGISPDILDLARKIAALSPQDREEIMALIAVKLARYPKALKTAAEEEKTMYPDTQPISFEHREMEPAYPQPVKVQKVPKIDNNVAAIVPIYYIPFYGKVAAGRPIDINIPPGRVVPVPAPVLKGDKTRYFSVEIRGTSMTNAGIHNGDYAVMCRAVEPFDGRIMLVRYGNESTLKRIKMKGKRVLLCWEDGSGEIIEVNSSEYEIQGEFVKLMRDPD
jgi:SOS-response transcriptional repressor LexA